MKLRLAKREGFAHDPGGLLYQKDGDHWRPADTMFSYPDRSATALTMLRAQLKGGGERLRVPFPAPPKPAQKRLLEAMDVDWYVDPDAAYELQGMKRR